MAIKIIEVTKSMVPEIRDDQEETRRKTIR